jgi:hypothetical protein
VGAPHGVDGQYVKDEVVIQQHGPTMTGRPA